ncbi:unnamed protein product [Ixodes pacificus]
MGSSRREHNSQSHTYFTRARTYSSTYTRTHIGKGKRTVGRETTCSLSSRRRENKKTAIVTDAAPPIGYSRNYVYSQKKTKWRIPSRIFFFLSWNEPLRADLYVHVYV